MWALRDPIPAVVISPLVPEPPVTGGQKRTLRLLEAMERAGLHPRILTADTTSDGGRRSACATGAGRSTSSPSPSPA